MSNKFIPVCEPFLNGNEEKYVLDALQTGWISSAGKYIPAFEEKFAEYIGVKHAIAVTNGTTALHLALVALGIKNDDEVIIPNFTMIASAFAVCYTGAKPVFVDAEPITWNIDTNLIKEKITKNTKAIMPVHIWGHPCNMNPIIEIAKKYNLKIIEDAAESHGATYNNIKCGALSDISCFSFFANKIITTGEGGMVLTNNDDLAEKCRYYKNLCFPLDGKRNYQHNHIGFNYRMSNIIAAIGLAQVEKIDYYIEKRRTNNELYKKNLSDTPELIFQPEESYAKNVYWMNSVVLNKEKTKIDRDTLVFKLKEKGVDTRLFFTGMNKQISLKEYGCIRDNDYPVSDYLTQNGFYLPSSSHLNEEDIAYICGVIKDIIKN
ncbi:MAG: DegT/DnrJ/EryC1/StrS family aminotransferase [Bacteroidales bacterium]|jgi:perosamine synthetase